MQKSEFYKIQAEEAHQIDLIERESSLLTKHKAELLRIINEGKIERENAVSVALVTAK